MKKTIKLLIALFIIFCYGSNYIVYAENEEIIKSQKESLNLSDFISESQRYVDENLEGIDVQALLNSAITGKIEDENLLKSIFNKFGDEVKNSIKLMRKCTGNCFNT